MAKGRASGAVVETDTGTVNTVRDGQIVRVRSYMARAEALKAAGLADQEHGGAARYSGAMSQQDVELVLDAYARFNAGEKVPELWFWHEDAEYHAAAEDPDSAVHRGIDGIRRQFASWLDAYPDLKVEPIESKENGDTVFLWVRFSGHGGESGVPMEMELAHVITMRDGRATRLTEYFDRAEGLEAAGISE